jgi:hypothetical protein
MTSPSRNVSLRLLSVAICVLGYASQTLLARDSQTHQTVTPAPSEQTQPIEPKTKAAAEVAQAIAAAKANTSSVWGKSTLARKYCLFQVVRNNPPDVHGISSTPAGPVVAADVVATAEADQLYEPFRAVFDLLWSFSDARSEAYRFREQKGNLLLRHVRTR